MADGKCPCCGQAVPADQIIVDLETNTVARNGEVVRITPSLVEMVSDLARRYPGASSREQLTQAIWGRGEEPGNALQVYACRLRPALAPLGVSIENIRGFGYRLVFDEAAS